AGVTFMAVSFWHASEDVPDLEQTINEYLIDASNEDYTHAYEIFSDEYKKVADLKSFTKTAVYLRPVYKGYQPSSLATEKFVLHVNFWEPSAIDYEGIFMYEDGSNGYVMAVFISHGDKWELVSINVIAPPKRLEKYTPPQKINEPVYPKCKSG